MVPTPNRRLIMADKVTRLEWNARIPMPSRRVTKPAAYSGARGREEFNVRVRGMAYNTHTSTLSGVKKSNTKIPTIRTTVRPYSARKGLLIGSCNPIPPSAMATQQHYSSECALPSISASFR